MKKREFTSWTSCPGESPNFPRAQYLNIRTLTHELIVNFIWKQFKDAIARNEANNSVKKAERK